MSVWAPGVAALGASALTGALGFGAIWWQQRHRDRGAALAEKGQAYQELIAHSMPFMMRAQTLRLAMQTRSGIREGINVVLRLRRASDPLDIYDWFAQGFEPLNTAWAKVQTLGSTEAERAATELLDGCADLLAVATELGTARGKVDSALRGLEWTAEQQRALEGAIQRLGANRRALIDLARKELGQSALLRTARANHRRVATKSPTRLGMSGRSHWSAAGGGRK